MDNVEALDRIERRFTNAIDANREVHNGLLLVHAPDRGIQATLAHGVSGGDPVVPTQPYHTASVGKTFTATLVGMLVEEGALDFDEPVAPYLPETLRDGLHVYRDRDYTDDILVSHLLAHTSGLPHLLAEEYALIRPKPERSAAGQTFFDVVLADPDRFWAPEETIAWATEHLDAHFPPGADTFYSEVGYNLLGLVVEDVTGQAYHEVLHERLFDPLGMERSYLSQFSEPAVAEGPNVTNVHIDEAAYEVERMRSFSGWFAGGQTVSTTEDLLAFHRALVEGRLVGPETFERMTQWRRLQIGIDYGYGLVRFRPLPFRPKYHVFGGLGATSSFMLYNPAMDVYLIGTFNQWSFMRKAMRFVFRTLRTVSKVEPAPRAPVSPPDA